MNSFRILAQFHFHPLFWLVIALGIMTARFQELILLFVIVFFHELGHAFAASFFSWRIRRIMLLPFGGVAEFDEHGNRPLLEETVVILAGPLQHLWMLFFAFLLHAGSFLSDGLYEKICSFNWMILLFNCLPILPLDGGRLMLVLFAKISPYILALRRAILCSLLFLSVYALSILLIFPYHLNAWLITVFLAISLYREWKDQPYVFMRFLLERYERKGESYLFQRETNLRVRPEETVYNIVKKFQKGKRHTVILTGGQKIKEVTLLEAFFDGNSRQKPIIELLS